MSLMLRLLSITAIVSSTLFASTEDNIIRFVKGQLSKNPVVTLDKVSVRQSFDVTGHKGWKVYIIDIAAKVKQKAGFKEVKTQDILFSDGALIAPDLLDVKSGESLKASVSPEFKASFYRKENLIYGNENARHKLAVFSDPLCPFCTRLIPQLIKDTKANPDKFALYMYHFPLSMHPAAKTIVKCMVAAEKKGIKDVVYRTYTAEKDAFTVRETNEKKILEEFNEALDTDLTMADINTIEVLRHIQEDSRIQSEMLVNSTPTLFFDGKKDPNRIRYKKAR